MIKKTFLPALLLLLMIAAAVSADPRPCDCHGGVDETGVYWFLLDFLGTPLEDGDWVYAAWAGPDGEIDPPDKTGGVTGDDSLLIASLVEYSSFFFTVTTWSELDGKHPMAGDFIYTRMFDGPQAGIGPSHYYADSQPYQVMNDMFENFFCQFPGDPGNGYTDTPVSGGTPVEEGSSPERPFTFALFSNRPNPFNASTEVRYRLAENGPVSLSIFNTLGQQVRRLVQAEQAAGEYAVIWDGRDGAGRELPAVSISAACRREDMPRR